MTRADAVRAVIEEMRLALLNRSGDGKALTWAVESWKEKLEAISAQISFDVDLDRRREEVFQCVIEHRNRLLKALKVAAPEFCSMRCPSHFASSVESRHTAECAEMRSALRGRTAKPTLSAVSEVPEQAKGVEK